MNFIKTHPDVHVSIQTRGSEFLADWLVTRQIDVALVGSRVENPYIDREPMISFPLFCALPVNHPLTKKTVIRATDLDRVPFVSFATGSQTDLLVRRAFSEAGAQLNAVLDTVIASTACEFVAAGLGVSLIHPLFAEGTTGRIVLRRFKPEIFFDFQLCRVRGSRNAGLVDAFMQEARLVAEEVAIELLHNQ